MVVSQLIFVLLHCLLAIQTQGEELSENELPEWTRSPAEPHLFVVETKEFSTHFDVTNGLLPAVRAGVKQWAQKTHGTGCDEVIDSIPLEDLSELIYQKQEHVHESRRNYDAETAKRLEAEYDIYFRGYVRVNLNESFRDQFQKRINKHRLKNRLCTTLVAALLGFGLAGLGWCYLFANRVSRGFYISRLRWITGTLLVALVVACYYVSQVIF